MLALCHFEIEFRARPMLTLKFHRTSVTLPKNDTTSTNSTEQKSTTKTEFENCASKLPLSASFHLQPLNQIVIDFDSIKKISNFQSKTRSIQLILWFIVELEEKRACAKSEILANSLLVIEVVISIAHKIVEFSNSMHPFANGFCALYFLWIALHFGRILCTQNPNHVSITKQ